MEQSWIKPKINWIADNYINIEDFNRIRNNIIYLYEASKKYIGYDYEIEMPPEVTYSDIAYADLWNMLVSSLKIIREHAPIKDDYDLPREYTNYSPYIHYTTLNDIEKAILFYYDIYCGLDDTIPELAVTLGNYKVIKV